MEGGLVAVGVGEGERATERAIDRGGNNGLSIRDESVVNGLNIGGLELPTRCHGGSATAAKDDRGALLLP